ncbi:MAG: type I-C CRISPR-associated protein Cas5c [Oscillospiraceae bacterium]|nr:type I-C CRISPR-associated protein Cas5c [Oscillospiraceae bacterium]
MHPNIVQFKVYGEYALFSDPITRIGGEKCSYLIPTYEAVKGIMHSVYWKPSIIWYIDKIRVMNPIQTETKGVRPLKWTGGNDLSYYTYLKDCCYQVQAHFEPNRNRPELEEDSKNENKHYTIARRSIIRGGRRDIFLGSRECQCYVEPCVFGEGDGAYDRDDFTELSFGLMYHGLTYPDEAYSEETKGCLTKRFFYPVMKKRGIIKFPRPEDCKVTEFVRQMNMKKFGKAEGNFIGLEEFNESEFEEVNT